jgi:hypothetical protein
LEDKRGKWKSNHNTKKKRYLKPKEVTVYKQKVALGAAYPEAKSSIIGRKTLVWGGKIRPSPFSKEYKVVLTWIPEQPPNVWIIGDELERLDDPSFPHIYHIDVERKMVRICLYRHQEFNQYTFIANTIIPWAKEWLYFYEMWLATGNWLGGGEHPSEGEHEGRNDSLRIQPSAQKYKESDFKLLEKWCILLSETGP